MQLVTKIWQQYPEADDYHACTSMKVSSYSGQPSLRNQNCPGISEDRFVVASLEWTAHIRIELIPDHQSVGCVSLDCWNLGCPAMRSRCLFS
jgi:hypothetical protein